MAWWELGDKPLPEPMMTKIYDATNRPRQVNMCCVIEYSMPWAPLLLTWFNFNPNMDK